MKGRRFIGEISLARKLARQSIEQKYLSLISNGLQSHSFIKETEESIMVTCYKLGSFLRFYELVLKERCVKDGFRGIFRRFSSSSSTPNRARFFPIAWRVSTTVDHLERDEWVKKALHVDHVIRIAVNL